LPEAGLLVRTQGVDRDEQRVAVAGNFHFAIGELLRFPIRSHYWKGHHWRAESGQRIRRIL